MQLPSVTKSERNALLEIQGRLMLALKVTKHDVGPYSPSRVLSVTPGLRSAVAKGFAEGVDLDPETGKPRRFKLTALGIAAAFGCDPTHPDFEKLWREQALA